MDGIAVSVDSLARGLVSMGCTVAVVSPGRSFAHEVDELGVQHWRVPSVRTPLDGYPLSVATAERMAQRIREFRPDFISIQTIGSVGLAALQAVRRSSVPVALSWHTDFESYLDKYRLAWLFVYPAYVRLRGKEDRGRRELAEKEDAPRKTRMIREILAYTAREADFLIAPSAPTARYLEDLGVERPIFVLPTGVDVSELTGGMPPAELLAAIEATPRDGRVIYAGRLSREKGIDFLCESFSHVVARRPDATLILTGPCKDPKMWFRLRAAKARLGRNLLVTGPVARRTMVELYRRVDVFVTASVTETQGIAVWEAALAGLPVVARDGSFGDVPDVSEDILSGFSTPAEFGEAILGCVERRKRAAAEGGARRVGLVGADRARLLLDAVGVAGGAPRPASWTLRDGAWCEE
ncbi:glycosyltransferase [Microtetraspora sp. NBRC 13810]|uniref:glycosyltransferase n=1 Tax=Microtetraspora sp. NBRC 13810 TaxID=3030990 RepID=UPI00255633D2|nr:glycosyltransferase [Microtetraspora sp. NBRC 13810]